MEQMSGTQGEGDTLTTNQKLQEENWSSKGADDPNSEEERTGTAGDSETSKGQPPKEIQTKGGVESEVSNATSSTGQEETNKKIQKKSNEGAADASSTNDGESLPDGGDPMKTEGTGKTSGESQTDGVRPTQTDERNIFGQKESKEGAADASSTNDGESLLDGGDPVKTEETAKTSGQSQTDGVRPTQTDERNIFGKEKNVDFETSKEQSSEESPNIRGNDSIDDGENITSKKKSESTFNDGHLLKKDEGTLEKASKDERESQSGGIKPTPVENRNTSGDIQREHETFKKKYDEMLRKFESISDKNQDLLEEKIKIEKERDQKIHACEDFVKKDIESQEKMDDLKTDLSGIKIRCNTLESQMKAQRTWFDKERLQDLETERKKHKIEIEKANKAYNEMEKKLKEEQKSWTKLQNHLEGESKKHKKEIEKANKAIGSLNQNIAVGDEELRKKEHMINTLKREKKEVEKQKADHETYIQELHNHIKKMNEEKKKDESEHTMKVKVLDQQIKAERANFNGLSFQYNELINQIKELQEEKRSLTREKQDLLLRLSKVAGANLTYNNPNIADLSDEKRPTKLAEEFSELYDNEWTDAFEDLPIESEKDKTAFMLKLIMRASQLCSDVSSDHSQNIKDSLCTLILPTKQSKFSNESIEKENTPRTITSSQDTSRNISKENEQENTDHTEKKEEETADHTNQSLSENEQEKTEHTEKETEETADDTNQSISKHEQEQKENGESKDGKDVDDTKLSQSVKDGEGTKHIDTEGAESLDDPNKPSLANENNENAQEKNEETANNAIQPPVAKEKKENAQEKNQKTTDNTNQPPVVKDGEGTKHTDTEVTESSDDPNKPQLANESYENAQEGKVETADNTNQPQVVKDGEGTKHLDTEGTESTDDPNKLPLANEINGNAQEKKEETDDNPNEPHAQADLVRVENKERKDNQDETFGLATSKDTLEQGDVHTNGEEKDYSCSSKERDMVTNNENLDDSHEVKVKNANAVKEIMKEEIKKKQVDVVTCNVDDKPEEKETDNNAAKEIGCEKIEKESTLVVDFDKLLQKEQKKTIMDAKKLVEKHLSEEIEAAGADLIIKEHGIDPQKQESVVEFIKKCLNICWSMNRNEPPVFVDFPDISEDVKFDTNMFKPYTKAGKYIDYIVWPAIYLHEEGPLLCKGVAQGRKK